MSAIRQPVRSVEGKGDRILSRGRESGQYRLRLAESPDDVRRAQALRFQIFNLEMREGLESSYHTLLDADRFDPVCDHLIVEESLTGELVGTYRLQTGINAARHFGYYSEQEFDFAAFEPYRKEMIELGRACVHKQHRNLSVLGVLWKGIALYARSHGGRYLVGCSSLTSQDPAEGVTMFETLREKFLSPAPLRTTPMPGWECDMSVRSDQSVRVPKLLTAYLAIGATICGPPALDREFKTIDFLTLLDLETLPAKTVQRYLT